MGPPGDDKGLNQLPKFNGENFSNWRGIMEWWLRGQDYLDLVTGVEENPSEVFQRTDRRESGVSAAGLSAVSAAGLSATSAASAGASELSGDFTVGATELRKQVKEWNMRDARAMTAIGMCLISKIFATLRHKKTSN